ncbi:molybdopterin-containing oxidoreductase family protein [Metabacillus arenae]|uniref:Molybdopterin-dependent oxidoreductase n=1 Tax=Metabacillus arenae TaxID=2771434 RepID=A0A926NJ88_9BACI|nr:molybdopterin-dependent oxidoreductase [Metabacillus arenae]MBD1381780.1 molybdopterin-dependent oxidoreductase [Metabacillus arenae]
MQSQVHYTSCAHDCGGKCPLEVKVENGKAISISGRKALNKKLNIVPCGRGLSYLKRLYHPERLTTPLLRVGERGQGQFKPISWEEAIKIITYHLGETLAKHGAGSIIDLSRTGAVSAVLHECRKMTGRFLNLLGGRLEVKGSYSFGAAETASNEVFGTKHTAHEYSDLLNSKLILLWGHNPAVTKFGSDFISYLQQARRKGIKIICIDPRKTETTRLADEWIPIKPGTDVAVLLAMAFVMIKEDLWDRDFVNQFTVGFESFRSNVQGEEDGVTKTPIWASEISGVPEEKIIELARLYATTKPATMQSGRGAQRSAQGEHFTRATATLATMTGNVGKMGGNSGGCGYGIGPHGFGLPVPENPVDVSVRITNWPEAIAQGVAGGFPTDIHMGYCVGGNLVHQTSNINRTIEAMRKLDFFVVHEQFLTLTARQADLVLPATTFMERNDIQTPWAGHGNFILYQQKVVEPPSGVRSDFEILRALADQFGKGEEFDNKGEEGWLRHFADQFGVPDFEEFQRSGIYELPNPLSIPFKKQVEEGVPFPTPSGKIQISSPYLADRGLPVCAVYQKNPEGVEDPQRAEFPLQLLCPKQAKTTNSILSEIESPPMLAMHPDDANTFNVGNKEWVRISNHRGAVRAQVRVTDQIVSGAVSLDNGYYALSEEGEVVGAVNVLTSERPTEWGDNITYHTCLVKVEKAV